MKKNFNCPSCGQSLSVEIVANANESANTLSAPAATKNLKARLEALKAAGHNVDEYFVVSSAGDNELLIRNSGAGMTVADENDPVMRMIIEKGTVPNRRLFRRWVLAQTFHMLRALNNWRFYHNYTDVIQSKGYEYQMQMIEEELRVQAKLYCTDHEAYRKRNRHFNKNVALDVAHDYVEKLREYIGKLQTHKCKGIPYKKIKGNNIFVDDLQAKVYSPVSRRICAISVAKDPRSLFLAFRAFNKQRIKLNWGTRMCKTFFDAFKGAGAYYSMENLIRFHGCVLYADKTPLSREDSLNLLEKLADNYRGEGWRLFGVLRKCLEDNKVDIDAKFEEWRKAKANR